MPIYEYKCNNCGKVFEQIIFKADEKPECPFCNNIKDISRVISTFSFNSSKSNKFSSNTTSNTCSASRGFS